MRIGFSTCNSLISWLIRWATHSSISHAYIVFEVFGQELVIQANHKGVVCDHYDNFKASNIIIAEFKLLVGENQKNEALSFTLKQLTKEYDYLGVLGFAWFLLGRMFGIQVKPFNNKSTYFCSELIIRAIQVANFPLSHMLNCYLTSPQDLLEFMEAHIMGLKIRGY